jgi:hypothetical protein
MVIAKIHEMFLLRQFVHLAEFVHVQLPDEGRQVLVPEEVGQHLVFQFLAAFDENLAVPMPAYELIELLGLYKDGVTSRIW